METQTTPAVKKTKKAAKKTKAMKSTKATIVVNSRVIRKGDAVPLTKLKEELTPKMNQNLETLEKKFGIEWKPTAITNTLSNKLQNGPAKPFVMEGKAKGGKSVVAERYGLSLYVDGKKHKMSEVKKMTPKQFSKL